MEGNHYIWEKVSAFARRGGLWMGLALWGLRQTPKSEAAAALGRCQQGLEAGKGSGTCWVLAEVKNVG